MTDKLIHPILDQTLIETASSSQKLIDDLLFKSNASQSKALMEASGKASTVANAFPVLQECFAIAASTTPPCLYISSKSLFSAQGPLAKRLQEHAALNYILNDSSYEFENAKKRIKSLFDFSEHFLSEEERKTAGVDISCLDTYLKLGFDQDNHEVNIEDPTKRVNVTKLTQSYYNYQQGYKWNIACVNEFGATMSIHHDWHGQASYQHPNETVHSTPDNLLFKGDKELIDQALNDFFVLHGYQYLDYNKKARLVELASLVERIAHHGSLEKTSLGDDSMVVRLDKHVISRTENRREYGSFIRFNADLTVDKDLKVTITWGVESTLSDESIVRGVPCDVHLRFRIGTGVYQEGRSFYENVIGEQILQNKAETVLKKILEDLENQESKYPSFDLLSKEEEAFVRTVFSNPGAKLSDNVAFGADGTVALWAKPIELGFIRTVGSYKWAPNTTQYSDLFNDSPGEGKIPAFSMMKE